MAFLCSTYELVAHLPPSDSADDWTLMVEITPPLLLKLLGAKPKVREYRGDCTVWRDVHNFCRCDSTMEGLLCDFWEEARYSHKSPTTPTEPRP